MTTEDRLTKLETLVLALGEIAEDHAQLLGKMVSLQEQQQAGFRELTALVSSLDTSVGDIAENLKRIDQHTALRAAGCTSSRHPGNHRYLFALGDRRARRSVSFGFGQLAYPKKGSTLP